MARRTRPNLATLKATLAALRESGMTPTALDTMPDGTCRWHFTPPPSQGEDDLDRELQAFEAKHHGYGRA
jgi:hypothetical protein